MFLIRKYERALTALFDDATGSTARNGIDDRGLQEVGHLPMLVNPIHLRTLHLK